MRTRRITMICWMRMARKMLRCHYHDMLDENGKKDAEMSQRNWIATKFIRPFNDGYGYQWWLERDGTYTALGVGGQYIMVSPEENLIVVFTSQSKGMGVLKPAKLFHDNIRKAVVSDEEIPATPA
ncbi:MAG: serine hydrolase, partial [Deltaproteobacteria bacterium]|nr:serine hydrolase [Deltaproteobacteria bacterium]